jgi:hypothetical protein
VPTTTARKWKYDGKTDQHWVEFEESGELWKLYLQQKDHIESKNATNLKAFQKLSATPDAFSAPGDDFIDVGTKKPSANREVQDWMLQSFFWVWCPVSCGVEFT